MFRRSLNLPSFSSVAAGATAVVNVPLGPRYHGINLNIGSSKASNNKIADGIISEIRLKVNGKVQQVIVPADYEAEMKIRGGAYNVSGSALTSWYAGNGAAADSENGSTFPIWLSEPWRPVEDQLLTSWGTGNISSLQIEVDIPAATTAPTLVGYALFDDAVLQDGTPVPIGNIIQRRKQTITIGATGVTEYQDFPRGDLYDSIMLKPSAITDISQVELKIENTTIYKDLDVDKQNALAYGLQRAYSKALGPDDLADTVASLYPILLCGTGRLRDALPTARANSDGGRTRVSSFELDLTMDAANNVTAYYQTYGPANI